VRAACRLFLAEGVETVAISFVWSVLYPDHERRAGEIVREMMPGVILTLGSALYPQGREYTRTSTAVANAYLAPILKRYVASIDEYFQSLGARQPVRYYQSNGGLAIGQAMTDRSVYAINSGPACAPAAGQYVCAPFGKSLGGTLPTVSDANLVLGYLNPDGLVGGRLPLDAAKAEEAVRSKLADPLGLSLERAAYGMFTIVNANMVNGIRRVTVERGYDPRDFVLVGAGGGDGGAYHRPGRQHGHRHHRAAETGLGALCLWPDHQ